MSLSVMQKTFFLWLSSRSRSQQVLIWSKYYSFCYIFWTVDSLATKLGLMIHHHKPECPVKKLLHSGSRSQRRVKMLMFVQMISSKPTFCFQTRYCDASLWVRVSCKKIYFWLLFSRWRSLQELIRSNYDNFCRIFTLLILFYQTWYGDASLWARLSFKKIASLSSRSRSQLRIVQSKYDFLNILSELLILLQLNLVWWYITIRWIVLWKDWIPVSYTHLTLPTRRTV